MTESIMILKSTDGLIEINVKVFSNKLIYGSPIGDCRKRLTHKIDQDGKPKQQDVIKRKKDPEDNLGAVISTLDTEKIERGVDFISIDRELNDILLRKKIEIKEFFEEYDEVAKVCERFELTLKEFVSIMMEHKPEVFNLSFLKSVIRPMVLKIQSEKEFYESKAGEHSKFKPIFDLL